MSIDTDKQRALEAIRALPDGATIDDAIERLCFNRVELTHHNRSNRRRRDRRSRRFEGRIAGPADIAMATGAGARAEIVAFALP